MNLRQITEKDQLLLKKVYFDSIQSIDEKIYTKDQKRSWSEQAWNNPNFDNAISKGRGWLIHKNEKIIAFALRYPESRVALLYCRGEYQRKGLCTKLLSKIESEITSAFPELRNFKDSLYRSLVERLIPMAK